MRNFFSLYFKPTKNDHKKADLSKLYLAFNTSTSFISGVCFEHLRSESCSCEAKRSIGYVRQQRKVFESDIEKKNTKKTYDEYKLNPTVVQRITYFEMLAKERSMDNKTCLQ